MYILHCRFLLKFLMGNIFKLIPWQSVKNNFVHYVGIQMMPLI